MVGSAHETKVAKVVEMSATSDLQYRAGWSTLLGVSHLIHGRHRCAVLKARKGSLADVADDTALQTANPERQNWEIRLLTGSRAPFFGVSKNVTGRKRVSESRTKRKLLASVNTSTQKSKNYTQAPELRDPASNPSERGKEEVYEIHQRHASSFVTAELERANTALPYVMTQSISRRA